AGRGAKAQLWRGGVPGVMLTGHDIISHFLLFYLTPYPSARVRRGEIKRSFIGVRFCCTSLNREPL
ncbi:hypothetical protein, partial [[Scytonema hofmanni] UTEX B 1581]|uniref:hypothetical protein n=1 Tax=[Scytonema hofmanni] UTEX B 1581 TaxID=379535 RepID=UPI001C8F56B5